MQRPMVTVQLSEAGASGSSADTKGKGKLKVTDGLHKICLGTKSDGQRCTFRAKGADDYCLRHQPRAPKAPTTHMTHMAWRPDADDRNRTVDELYRITLHLNNEIELIKGQIASLSPQ